ncbi:MAG: flagellar basal body rod protein FlgF [Pseudohongiellaceae bacterium]
MDHLIYTAMSGARRALDEQAVISHNLANASTNGFRAQLMASRAVPVEGPGELSTRVSAGASTPGVDWSPGPVSSTGRELDVALDGNAWLAIQDDQGAETYTRRGDLQVDGNGLLRSGGHPVIGENGPIVVPLDAQVSIGRDGTISAIGAGQAPDALMPIGRLKLVEPGARQLLRGDDGLFRAPPGADGQPGILPRGEGLTLRSGALEGSNVSPVESMVAMIDNARNYEMQMQVIQTADENAQRANSLLALQG